MGKEDIIGLCRAYASATNVPAMVVDVRAGTTLASVPPGHGFCRVIEERCGRGEVCRRAHLYGSYQAERFGDYYVFFCPFGLVHWAAPIVEDSALAHAFVAGPVLMSTPADALIDEILAGSGLSRQEIGMLRAEIGAVPYAPPARVNDLGRLLYAAASSLSARAAAMMEERRARSAQQASIGTLLQDLKRTVSKESYPLALEKELIAKIRLGDKPGAQELLNRILGYVFFERGHDLDSIKIRVTELVVLLSRGAIEGGADEEVIFGLNYRFLQEVQGLRSVDEIAGWLSKVMARFTEFVFNLANIKNKDIIYKAVAYIRENHMRDITLDSVAQAVHLSPSYFSRVFKEEMKQNFRAYLNSVRVEFSKMHLADEGIPLAQVAGLVGYQDQSYFTKVFKRLVGVSPGEYRRARGMIGNGRA